MFSAWKRQKNTILARSIVFLLITSFSLGLIAPQVIYAQNLFTLPTPGTMLTPTTAYAPANMLGMTINPSDPFQIDFIIDRGQSGLYDQALEEESQKLLQYFYAAMTVPEEEMWVNLSPYEAERIIATGLGETVLGRDMLAQDYLLKQLAASMAYPESELGKTFWKRVRDKISAQYGATEIPMNTFNKIWIMPDTANVYRHENSVFVVDHHLKVMLEEDYLALEHNSGSKSTGDPITGVTNDIVREILIPEIEREVNEGKTFAPLRQMFHSMILATWYKQNLKSSLLTQMLANQNKTTGIALEDKAQVQEIYDQYVQAFEKGVYDYIKEETDPTTGETIPRKYFSGGIVQGDLDMTTQTPGPAWIQQRKDNAMTASTTIEEVDNDAAMARKKFKPGLQNNRAKFINEMRELLAGIERQAKNHRDITSNTGASVLLTYAEKIANLKSWLKEIKRDQDLPEEDYKNLLYVTEELLTFLKESKIRDQLKKAGYRAVQLTWRRAKSLERKMNDVLPYSEENPPKTGIVNKDPAWYQAKLVRLRKIVNTEWQQHIDLGKNKSKSSKSYAKLLERLRYRFSKEHVQDFIKTPEENQASLHRIIGFFVSAWFVSSYREKSRSSKQKYRIAVSNDGFLHRDEIVNILVSMYTPNLETIEISENGAQRIRTMWNEDPWSVVELFENALDEPIQAISVSVGGEKRYMPLADALEQGYSIHLNRSVKISFIESGTVTFHISGTKNKLFLATRFNFDNPSTAIDAIVGAIEDDLIDPSDNAMAKDTKSAFDNAMLVETIVGFLAYAAFITWRSYDLRQKNREFIEPQSVPPNLIANGKVISLDTAQANSFIIPVSPTQPSFNTVPSQLTRNTGSEQSQQHRFLARAAIITLFISLAGISNELTSTDTNGTPSFDLMSMRIRDDAAMTAGEVVLLGLMTGFLGIAFKFASITISQMIKYKTVQDFYERVGPYQPGITEQQLRDKYSQDGWEIISIEVIRKDTPDTLVRITRGLLRKQTPQISLNEAREIVARIQTDESVDTLSIDELMQARAILEQHQINLESIDAETGAEFKKNQADLLAINTAIERRHPSNDAAMNGGIDLNAAHLELEGVEEPIQFDFDPAQLDFDPATVNGIVPVILNMTPVTNLPLLLGLHRNEYFRHEETELSSI